MTHMVGEKLHLEPMLDGARGKGHDPRVGDDGIEWRTEWDTEMEGALPMAIQVMLVMRPFDGELTTSPAATGLDVTMDETSLRYYRLVVRLPTGQPAESEESADAAGTATGTEGL